MHELLSEYKGVVIEESLDNPGLVESFLTQDIEITREENPQDRWHLYKVVVSPDEIEKVSRTIKKGWYAHFWKDNDMIVIFRNKHFKIDPRNPATWKEAVEYGLSVGIPLEQLNFPAE